MKRVLSIVLMLTIVLSLGITAFADSWTCMGCGTENSDKFCGNCGMDRASSETARREAENAQMAAVQRESVMDFSRSETWICFPCGKEITTNFCTSCGAKRSEGLIGGYVTFGAYERDNNTENGAEPIEWIVLDQNANGILVISRYALDAQPYNAEFVDTTWENCTLRSWLNGEFRNAAFTTGEQAMIHTITVTADKNPKYSTDPGNDTQDQVFLLSTKEVNKYLSSDEARKCAPTAYAIANGAWTSDKYTVGGAAIGWWWLRSPGGDSNGAAYVDTVGSVLYSGYDVDLSSSVVRPALWIGI